MGRDLVNSHLVIINFPSALDSSVQGVSSEDFFFFFKSLLISNCCLHHAAKSCYKDLAIREPRV